MADLAITRIDFPASLRSQTIQIGVAVSRYQLLYLDATTGKHLLASASAIESAQASAIALMDGDIDTWIAVLPLTGTINVTLTAGSLVINTDYVVAVTAGAIAPEADLLTGNFKTQIGSGISATQMKLAVQATGLAMP